ncbi:hypothetical protein [Actinokineospora diospyrosa]|uniref:Uncharacterized protein n=1 Tax=Actinokineospora diospyrosa TaxID=103728 RepID=A0ABT1IF85_9PSEU|nr:hypothetical protein [Actinokineospora diospyrosa]MCP2271301.1 hypothetical protein [Actinokineospora diospyrosa]
MTLEGVYGMQPALLPRSMVRLTLADKKLLWVGRPGVELLDFERHYRYENESLHRFPQHRDGTIDWTAVDSGLVLDEASTEFEVAMSRWLRLVGDRVVVIWSEVVVPSVMIAVDLFAELLADIAGTFAEFWVYSPDARVLVENTFAGQLTAARLPDNTSSSRTGARGSL